MRQTLGTVAIVGATSPIARALASRFAAAGYSIVLAGRELDEIERTAADLSVRYGTAARCTRFEATDYASHAGLVRQWIESPEPLVGIVLCHGYMAEQRRAQADFELAKRMIEVNYVSAVSVLERLAPYFETLGSVQTRPRRFICCVSSVAGDRGRQSNYLYGSTKAALSTYLQGLRNRLTPSGVQVLTVKPGLVDTRMTYERGNGLLVAHPDSIAAGIFRALASGRDVVYTPAFWRWIMLALRLIPETVFKRLRT